ncbi:hypothetical protein [Chromobacterium haemolyticum]|uniref:hypothetical protein n=1 Tax=Chromobacterium haemolyticum TaxID=394935 RepID=UPI00307D5D35
MTEIVKVKGVPVTLGDKKYIIPPLNLGALEQLQERLAAFTGGIDAASVGTVLDAAHAALLRNYPGITRDDVAAVVDVGNMGDVMEAVMDVSGLKRKAIEAEAAAAGEPTGKD